MAASSKATATDPRSLHDQLKSLLLSHRVSMAVDAIGACWVAGVGVRQPDVPAALPAPGPRGNGCAAQHHQIQPAEHVEPGLVRTSGTSTRTHCKNMSA